MRNTSHPITRSSASYATGDSASGRQASSPPAGSGFDGHRPSGPLAGLPSRSSVRPGRNVRHAGLLPEERAKIGVARWPDPHFDTSDSAANVAYGLRFAIAVDDAARQLGSGQLRNIEDVWRFATHWRMQQGDATGDFSERRLSNGAFSLTPITGKYEFVADKAKNAAAAKLINYPGRPDIHLVQLRQSVQINGTSIPLTEIRLPYRADSRLTELADDAMPPMISHTAASRIPVLLQEVERLRMTLPARSDVNDRIQTLGHMHWLLANAMPDKRGSGAKSEMCIRAIGTSLGLTMPPFKHGVIPDLEAFVTPMEEFRRGYAALFESPPTSQP
ncbi:XopAH/AvrB family type III secretion system effector [Xanthomonas translucens]|uniref:XopAH/AvrB family type III secretion system effector n=1 Tax=Xanthomonas translucens pv. translucens TaxID=134875 RepID=A0ABW9KUG7_XANCT|nr:XopAH/AvrB family type III secretion system effector [Xanthomonas translucens]MCC8448119.1 type III effector protein AvrB3 [Xanthomonas translucens pv. translucens]